MFLIVRTWCCLGGLGGLGVALVPDADWSGPLDSYFHFLSFLPSDDKRFRIAWKRLALGVLPPTSFETGCAWDVLNKWTVAFLLPGDSFYMDGKLQMGPKAEMQIGRAVIRSIWQDHRLKSSLPTAAWSCFFGCADTAGCGLHCELFEWSFGLKTVGLGPVPLAPWSRPSPVHPSAACKKPSEVYSLQNDCCDYSFAEKCSSEREQLISFYNPLLFAFEDTSPSLACLAPIRCRDNVSVSVRSSCYVGRVQTGLVSAQVLSLSCSSTFLTGGNWY